METGEGLVCWFCGKRREDETPRPTIRTSRRLNTPDVSSVSVLHGRINGNRPAYRTTGGAVRVANGVRNE